MEPKTDRGTYVNLLLNEERWTGYNGSRVWDMIYSENCFSGYHPASVDQENSTELPFVKSKPKSLHELCYEERVSDLCMYVCMYVCVCVRVSECVCVCVCV